MIADHRPAWALLLGAALTVLAACNGGDSPSAGNGSTEPTSSSEASTADSSSGTTAAPVVCGQPTDVFLSDAEYITLEGCEVFEGTLVLTTNVTDLSPIASLRVIRGGLEGAGQNDNHDSLAGFEAIESVGRFDFYGNSFFDLEGVRGLREVEGDFSLDTLVYLTSLDGLMSLERIGGNLDLVTVPMLPQSEIDEFLARVEVVGEVNIQ